MSDMSEPTPPGDRHDSAAPSSAGAAATGGASGMKDPQQTMLQQMGGVSGLAYSAVPIIVFVVVNSLFSMVPAIWAAIGVAVAIMAVRVVRKEPLQPAISGVLGVAVCSFIAYQTGEAKGFFLLGIWTNLVYGSAFLLSIIVRWPLVGVAWSALNSLGFSWRRYRKALTAYDLATLSWVVVFGSKFIVQHWLYAADLTGWLAVARIGMGYPLTAIALLITIWAIRRVSRVVEEAEGDSAEPGTAETSTATVRDEVTGTDTGSSARPSLG